MRFTARCDIVVNGDMHATFLTLLSLAAKHGRRSDCRLQQFSTVDGIRRPAPPPPPQLVINSLTVERHFKSAISYPRPRLTLSGEALKLLTENHSSQSG